MTKPRKSGCFVPLTRFLDTTETALATIAKPDKSNEQVCETSSTAENTGGRCRTNVAVMGDAGLNRMGGRQILYSLRKLGSSTILRSVDRMGLGFLCLGFREGLRFNATNFGIFADELNVLSEFKTEPDVNLFPSGTFAARTVIAGRNRGQQVFLSSPGFEVLTL